MPFVAQHVWVATQVLSDPEAPGLLLEWRREDDGWLGLVIYAERHRGRRGDYWTARTQWVEAARITPERKESPTSP